MVTTQYQNKTPTENKKFIKRNQRQMPTTIRKNKHKNKINCKTQQSCYKPLYGLISKYQNTYKKRHRERERQRKREPML